MNPTWRLTQPEFATIWHLFGRDRPPFPFQFRSTDRTVAEASASRAVAAARMRQILDEDLYAAFAILADPSVRVEALGLDRPATAHESAVRIHAALRGGRAVVVAESTRPDGFVLDVDLVPAGIAPRRVVELLPAAARGQRPALHRPGPEPDAGGVLRESRYRSGRQVVTEFFDRPRDSTGVIAVTPGSAIDARNAVGTESLGWTDFTGDGRYLVRRVDHTEAVPAGPRDVEQQILRLVDRAGRVHSDRSGTF
ncbi:ESX secretion-associated protein EspG [Rhodococcus phenolicus]|uniref:ESX secretion-associated protein EspG n=1 Tax=Rhodococcus phenolicus TaxID=263849 RepID=UPI00083389A6|nr:ESX secretion-associated protein EspG [Rhodococcus phenolicus]